MATVSSRPTCPDRPEGFEQEVRALVADTAPGLFAVVEEYPTEDGELDAWVAAWGLELEDGTVQVVGVDGRFRISAQSLDRAEVLLPTRGATRCSVVRVGDVRP